MAVIDVRTPDGTIEKVRIAGDTPTQEEQEAIRNQFFSSDESEPAAGAEETPVSKEDIDYKTGVRSSKLRYWFSRGENEREKKLQLLALGIPEEGIIRDQQGRFILDLDNISEDIKDEYGLKAKEGVSKVAIDEEGFSRYDFVDFGGEAGTPILFGTAAALASTGFGIPAAMAIVGAASSLGYIADEALEYSRGVRDQTLGEDAKNLAFEFLAGGLGEGAGRLIARGLGRLAKGPGNIEANTIRETARTLLNGEVDQATGRVVRGAPTVRATNAAPLIGRAQAFFEGVFPNARVATKNAEYMQVAYQNFLREAGIPERQAAKTSEDLLEALKTDIRKMYSTPDELVKNANKVLRNTVEKEINSLISRFGDTSFEGGEAALRGVEVAKRAFDESADELYSSANKLLDDAAVIPTRKVKADLEEIAQKSLVTGKAIKDSSLGQVIAGLDDFITVDAMNGIRTALREAAYDPSLLGSPDKALLRSLKGSVDNAILEAETTFLDRVQRMAAAKTPVGTAQMRGKGGRFEMYSRADIAKIEGQKAGFEALRQANEFYQKGMRSFDTLFAQQLISGSRTGGKLADPEAILDEVVLANRPKLLSDLLDATTPPPLKGPWGGYSIREAPESFLDIVPNVRVKGPDGRVVNLRDTIAANPNDDLAKFYQARFQSQKEFSEEVAAARLAGGSYRDAVRDSLARRWMERTVNSPDVRNIFGQADPLKIVGKIRDLQKTAPVLFGEQYNPIMKSLTDLSLLGEEVGQAELRNLAGRPIAEQLEWMNALTKQAKDTRGIGFIRALENAASSGEVDKVVSLVTRNKDTIRQAKQFLGADSDVMNAVKDEILVRAIGSLGDPSSTVVQKGLFGRSRRTVSPEFVKDVMSGKQHDKIVKVLDTMGRENMESLFGKEFIDQMTTLARKSEAASMRSLANLGGLETAKLARSLTLGAMFVRPVQVLGTLTGLRAMGAILRNKSYLRMLARPTGDLENAKNLERALGVAWGIVGRSSPQAVETQAQEMDAEVERKSLLMQDRLKRQNFGATSPQIRSGTPSVPPLQPPASTRPQVPTASSVERERIHRQLIGLAP